MMINAFRNRTLQFETQLSKEQRSFNCKYFQKHEEVKEEPESETVNHKDAEEKRNLDHTTTQKKKTSSSTSTCSRCRMCAARSHMRGLCLRTCLRILGLHASAFIGESV